jgi:hypothetical protein
LLEATIHSRLGNAGRLRYGSVRRDFEMKAGEALKWDGR